MSLKLYAHPFSSYCQKVLIPLYENGIAFEYQRVNHDDAAIMAELEMLWPFKKFPVLVDSGRVLRESSIIVEYLDSFYPGKQRFIPEDREVALEARFMDRFFDNYVMTPLQKLVFDRIRPADKRDAHGVNEAHKALDTAYCWLDATMAEREWAVGREFTLADCAAAPALFYADWAYPIDAKFSNVIVYRKRLLARPSFARAVDEARPYRAFFPLGAPDRD